MIDVINRVSQNKYFSKIDDIDEYLFHDMNLLVEWTLTFTFTIYTYHERRIIFSWLFCETMNSINSV